MPSRVRVAARARRPGSGRSAPWVRPSWASKKHTAAPSGTGGLQPADVEALEVLALGVREVDRVVERMAEAGEQLGVHAGLGSRREHDALEFGRVHVLGAREREQLAARRQEIEGRSVDLLVTAQRCLDLVPLLGESRRIEDHQVEALAGTLRAAQQIERVAVHGVVGRQPVALEIALSALPGIPITFAPVTLRLSRLFNAALDASEDGE